MVKELAFIAYSVKDVPAATAFYRDVLGLKPGDMVSEHWTEFDLGGTAFGIGNGESLGIPPGSSSGAAFEVDDIEAMRAKVADAGGNPSEVHDFPMCRACFARDPEGNQFALHQRKS